MSLTKYIPSTVCLIILLGCASGKSLSPKVKKANIYYDQGTVELIKGNYTKALTHFLEAKKLNPNDTRLQNNLGMSYYFKNRYQKAIYHLQQAIRLDPENSDALNNLAGVYFKQGHLAQAKKYYTKVRDHLTYHHQYRTYYNLALLDIRQGDLQSAVSNLKQSIKDRQDYCPALYRLGMIEKERNNYLKSLKYFQEGIKGACYEKPEPHLQLGLIWKLLGKDDKAKNKFQEIQTKFPDTPYEELAKKHLRNLMAHSEGKYKVLSRKNRLEDEIPKPLAY